MVNTMYCYPSNHPLNDKPCPPYRILHAPAQIPDASSEVRCPQKLNSLPNYCESSTACTKLYLCSDYKWPSFPRTLYLAYLCSAVEHPFCPVCTAWLQPQSEAISKMRLQTVLHRLAHAVVALDDSTPKHKSTEFDVLDYVNPLIGTVDDGETFQICYCLHETLM